jgi:hypothetical protein
LGLEKRAESRLGNRLEQVGDRRETELRLASSSVSSVLWHGARIRPGLIGRGGKRRGCPAGGGLFVVAARPGEARGDLSAQSKHCDSCRQPGYEVLNYKADNSTLLATAQLSLQ